MINYLRSRAARRRTMVYLEWYVANAILRERAHRMALGTVTYPLPKGVALSGECGTVYS